MNVIQLRMKSRETEPFSCSCGAGGFRTLEEWIRHTDMMGGHLLVCTTETSLPLCKETADEFRDPARREKSQPAQ